MMADQVTQWFDKLQTTLKNYFHPCGIGASLVIKLQLWQYKILHTLTE